MVNSYFHPKKSSEDADRRMSLVRAFARTGLGFVVWRSPGAHGGAPSHFVTLRRAIPAQFALERVAPPNAPSAAAWPSSGVRHVSFFRRSGTSDDNWTIMETKRRIWVWVVAIFFIGAGANHFVHPSPYYSMMPGYLPWPRQLVWISGVAEILGGFGALVPITRTLAGWGLILLLLAVFPANLNVALNGWPGVNLPVWSLWARLPLQILMLWVVLHVLVRDRADRQAGAFRG